MDSKNNSLEREPDVNKHLLARAFRTKVAAKLRNRSRASISRTTMLHHRFEFA